MKKYIIAVVALLVLILGYFGYQKLVAPKLMWSDINNTEWSNFDDWAGSGFHFLEENEEKKAIFMVYGSGVPIAIEYESKLVMKNGNKIYMDLPDLAEPDSGKLITIELTYNKDHISFNNKIFKKADKITYKN